MKKSVKKIIDETFQNKKDWNYYSEDCFDKNPMLSIPNSKKFLKEFIDIAGKGGGMLYDNIKELDDRTRHVVSAFFIGHYIYTNNKYLKGLIDGEINNLAKASKVTSDVCFSFVWFLTCLYHDLGYTYEEKNPAKFKDYNALTDSVCHKLKKIDGIGIPKFYNQIYKNYFKYRLKEHNKNDHGIVGAYLMYDSLYKIREREEAGQSPNNNSQMKLCWEKQLLDVYNYCAWNILGHNIWFRNKCKSLDVNLYSKYKMKRLLLEPNKKKIELKTHSFFFFFCLVDTIEPYKRTLDYNSLDKIYLQLDEEKIIISTSLKCACGQSIIKQAKGLNNWLTTTKEVANNSVEIYFTPQNM